jgi:CheY-like chemotaxis protein
MNTMKILLVEDAEEQQQAFIDTVDAFNEKYNLTVETDIVTDPLSALKKIDNSYNGAIIDLKLGDDYQGGNEIVRRLHDLSINVPVIFATAYLDLVEDHPLIIKKRSRDAESYESDILCLQEWYKTEPSPAETAQTYTALVRESEGWWIGWILEVPGVTCQERTRNELLDTLQITLREILEDETLEVSRRTESESEAVRNSDILEFGVPGASHQTEGGFEEVRIDI